MPSEYFPFRIYVVGENPLASALPVQLTKKQLLDYIRRRWTDPYVRREMVRYFSKFPGNTLNHMVGRLHEIAAEFERKRDENDA